MSSLAKSEAKSTLLYSLQTEVVEKVPKVHNKIVCKVCSSLSKLPFDVKAM